MLLDDFYKDMSTEDRDPDGILVSASRDERHQGVKTEHLSNVCRIDIDQAKDTLDITTQNSVRTDNPKLSSNYRTNDRMLRYKRINENFYMDTFFATKKSGKSTRQNICCHIFVTDKRLVYVVPVKLKSNALKSVKKFEK